MCIWLAKRYADSKNPNVDDSIKQHIPINLPSTIIHYIHLCNLIMAHTIHYLFLLLLSCICQQSYALFAASSTKGVSLAVTFPPRGGGLGFGRRNGPPPEEDTAIIDTDESEEDNTDEDLPPFDIEEANTKIYKEEVEEIKQSQQLIQKQRRRRELDTSWLDKGITAIIEFFENLFSWEVIDV